MTRKEAVGTLREWMLKIEESLGNRDVGTLCEGTKMVLAFAMILHTYFSDELPREKGERIKELFERALECASSELSRE